MNNLAQQIQALLFALGRPLSRAELVKMTGSTVDEVEQALAELSKNESGIKLVDDGKIVELRASPEAAELIEKVRKDEYAREVGRAGQEALAAILYRGPLTRAEIDFIRGVNSSQTLRTLTMRGLVRRVPNPRDERSFLYETTTELLATLGITRPSGLKEYSEVRAQLAELEKQYKEIDSV